MFYYVILDITMTTDSNKAGPTTLWKTLKGKKVRTNNGKDLGEIKEVYENYLHVENEQYTRRNSGYQNMLRMLLMDEEELRGKYHYGTQPPPGDQYSKEFESFKGTPYGQNANYATDFNDNIRVVENYKNIRDLK